MMLLLVVNDELKTRIQAIRQSLVLHDAISASIEFTGVFVKADGPLFHQENVMEELIVWFSEHNVPTKSGVQRSYPMVYVQRPYHLVKKIILRWNQCSSLTHFWTVKSPLSLC